VESCAGRVAGSTSPLSEEARDTRYVSITIIEGLKNRQTPVVTNQGWVKRIRDTTGSWTRYMDTTDRFWPEVNLLETCTWRLIKDCAQQRRKEGGRLERGKEGYFTY
jgi:hypothetical protein